MRELAKSRIEATRLKFLATLCGLRGAYTPSELRKRADSHSHIEAGPRWHFLTPMRIDEKWLWPAETLFGFACGQRQFRDLLRANYGPKSPDLDAAVSLAGVPRI
jgi:hypothetical protein